MEMSQADASAFVSGGLSQHWVLVVEAQEAVQLYCICTVLDSGEVLRALQKSSR